MKKKLVTILISLSVITAFTACGSDATSTSKSSSDQKEAQTQEKEPEKEEEQPQVEEENGMRKEVVYTNEDLGISGQTGPIKYSATGIQISKLTATTDDAAQLLGVEKDKEVCLVVVEVSEENTTDDTNYFYIGQATLTSSTKEQIDPDMILSDYIDGELLGKVVNSGQNVYILPNSSADDITNVSLHVDAPTDSAFNAIGDEVTIDIPINK